MGVSITVDDTAARAMLARVGSAGTDAKTMRKVAMAAKQQVYNAFRFQQAPDGAPWPGLSPLTIAARKRKGNASTQPLIATGAMYASVDAEGFDGEALVSVGKGLSDARAWYNQFGTSKIPARAMLPDAGQLPPAWLADIQRVTQTALAEAAA